MAFKMKGSFHYGKGNQSPNKMTGDPKKQTSTSATINLLGRLEDYEANKAEKDYRDAGETSYYAGDLPGYLEGKDAPASTIKEMAKRKEASKATQVQNKAQSTEEYIAKEAKFDATVAQVAKKEKDRKAEADANKAAKKAKIAAHPKNWNTMSQRQRRKWNEEYQANA